MKCFILDLKKENPKYMHCELTVLGSFNIGKWYNFWSTLLCGVSYSPVISSL